MLKQSFDKIYINTGNEDVLKLVTNKGCNILNAGCGSGALAKKLCTAGHTVDGITISAQEYDVAKENVNNIYLHNFETGLAENILHLQYDYVICSHVLEYIVYPENFLKDIYTVLKPGGFLIIALPNIMHYKSRMKLLAGKFDYEDAGIWDNTHVKWYTFNTAKKMLSQSGFFIELATVTGRLPFNSLFSRIVPQSIRSRIFSFLIKISKGFLGYQLLLKAKKPDYT